MSDGKPSVADLQAWLDCETSLRLAAEMAAETLRQRAERAEAERDAQKEILDRSWIAHCKMCEWIGPSMLAESGGENADAGDYNDPVCPECIKLGEYNTVSDALEEINEAQSTIAELTDQLSASSFQNLINRAADAESRAAVADVKAEMAGSRIAELNATVERMRGAIILHVADLELTVDRVGRFPGFEKTVDQFRLAVTELRAALGEP